METLPQPELFPCSRCPRRLPRTLEFFASNGHGGLWQYCRNCHLPGTTSTYKRRQQAGVCIKCEGPRESDGLRCDICADDHNERRRARRDKWVAQGRCQVCGSEDPVPDKQTCQRCADVRSTSKANQRIGRISRGMCPLCGERPPLDGKRHCGNCSDEKNQEYAAIRDAAIDAYGGKCACCGETNRCFLSIDHVKNNGGVERRENKVWIGRKVKRLGFPPEYQLLCYNCNFGKGLYGTCPHTWANAEAPTKEQLTQWGRTTRGKRGVRQLDLRE